MELVCIEHKTEGAVEWLSLMYVRAERMASLYQSWKSYKFTFLIRLKMAVSTSNASVASSETMQPSLCEKGIWCVYKLWKYDVLNMVCVE